MAAQKYSLCLVMLICSCVNSGTISDIEIINQVQGCSTLLDNGVQQGEPVMLKLEVQNGNAAQDCECKSALFQYTAFQTHEGSTSNLISGSFTTFNKTSVTLPVSVQSQLIYDDQPLSVRIVCAN